MRLIDKISSCFLLATLTSLTACGGGGGGGGSPAPLQPPTVNLTGTWKISEEILTATPPCVGSIGTLDEWEAEIVQSGNTLTVRDTATDDEFSGTVNGNRIEWSGQFPDDGGIVTISGMVLTATDDSNASGTVAWSFSDGTDFCRGTTRIGTERIGAPPSLDLSGLWAVADKTIAASGVCIGEIGVTDEYRLEIIQESAEITQSGVAITVIDEAGNQFLGRLTGNRIVWSGSFPDDGGTTTIDSMSLTATVGSISGTIDWSWTDGVDSCTGSSEILARRLVESAPEPATVLISFPLGNERDLTVLAVAHGQDWSEAAIVAALQNGSSALIELPAGSWDIAIAAFDAELAEDLGSMQVIQGFKDLELLPGDGLVLTADSDR